MTNNANFYDISENIELSKADNRNLSPKETINKFHTNIINELNSNSKYKIGDIIFLGEKFAIVDQTLDKLNYVLGDHPVNLPFGSILSKIQENNIKYKNMYDILRSDSLYELFIDGDEEEIFNAYKQANIY